MEHVNKHVDQTRYETHRFALLDSHQDPVPQYGQSRSLSIPDMHDSWSAV